MVRLRLFANLREAAGKTSVEFAGATVGEVIAAATAAYGADFESGLKAAKIWVNGDPAKETTTLMANDEIALIPPVSGGQTVARAEPDAAGAMLVATLVASLVVSNFVSEELFSLVVVGVGVAWLWDVTDTMQIRGVALEVIPIMVAAAAAANGAYGWGAEGLASGLALGLLFQLIWVVLDRRSRSIESVARAVVLGLAVGLGAGSLILVRLRSEEEVTLFLVLSAASAVAAWAANRFAAGSTTLDPNVAGLTAALATGVVVALTTSVLDLPVMILASIAVGSGFVAGRTLGSLSRSGAVVHTRRAPGLLTITDGSVPTAAFFWIILLVFG